MTTTEILREEVIQFIEHADDKALLLFKSMMDDIEENANTEGDWWDEVPAEIQASILKGMEESDRGKGIPHEEVVKRYSKWLKR